MVYDIKPSSNNSVCIIHFYNCKNYNETKPRFIYF